VSEYEKKLSMAISAAAAAMHKVATFYIAVTSFSPCEL
jgi:hypothetical protein